MRTRTMIALLALLIAGGTAAWKYIPHTLSPDECSNVYRYFVDMELHGVSITYVRDKKVNDTLRLPVTLLKAETDEGWAELDSLFGCTSQIEEILNIPDLPDSVKHELLEYPFSFYGFQAHRETPEAIVKAEESRPDDLSVYIFLNQHCVTIYETTDAKNEYGAVSSNVIKNQEEITP